MHGVGGGGRGGHDMPIAAIHGGGGQSEEPSIHGGGGGYIIYDIGACIWIEYTIKVILFYFVRHPITVGVTMNQ